MKSRSYCLFLVFFCICLPINSFAYTSEEVYKTAINHENDDDTFTCKVFVQHVISHVGGSLGVGYRDCYLNEGEGEEIFDERLVLPGDIIQISNDENPNDVSHVHSAIVTKNLGSGLFETIHSNWHLDLNVSVDRWNPSRWAKYGSGTTIEYPNWSAHFYRLGNNYIGHDSVYSYSSWKKQAFVEAYNKYNSHLGWPHNNGGGVFVHKWESHSDPRFRVWLQDFKNSEDYHSSLVLDEYSSVTKAYRLHEGFRYLYMNDQGPYKMRCQVLYFNILYITILLQSKYDIILI